MSRVGTKKMTNMDFHEILHQMAFLKFEITPRGKISQFLANISLYIEFSKVTQCINVKVSTGESIGNRHWYVC